MTIATDLDGDYVVNTVSDYDGPLKKQSDGETTINGGRTHRIDEAGCEWSSLFRWVDDEKTQVKMISIADPINAKPGFLLTHPDGTPTAEKVTYEAVLNVMRKGDKIQMTGTLNYGSETVILTMRKK